MNHTMTFRDIKTGDVWKANIPIKRVEMWHEGRSDYVLVLKSEEEGNRRNLVECLNAEGAVEHISLAAFYTDFTRIYRIPE